MSYPRGIEVAGSYYKDSDSPSALSQVTDQKVTNDVAEISAASLPAGPYVLSSFLFPIQGLLIQVFLCL